MDKQKEKDVICALNQLSAAYLNVQEMENEVPPDLCIVIILTTLVVLNGNEVDVWFKRPKFLKDYGLYLIISFSRYKML